MMSETIPQNELSAILLGTELTFSIKKDPSKPTDFSEGLGVQVTWEREFNALGGLEWLNLGMSEENIELMEQILKENKDLINFEFQKMN